MYLLFTLENGDLDKHWNVFQMYIICVCNKFTYISIMNVNHLHMQTNGPMKMVYKIFKCSPH